MFTVYDKENKEVKVYDVQRDKNGYPQFLIRHNNVWIYRSAKHYTTEQKRKDDYIKKLMCNHEYDEIRGLYPYTEYRCKKCGHKYCQ